MIFYADMKISVVMICQAIKKYLITFALIIHFKVFSFLYAVYKSSGMKNVKTICIYNMI